MHWRNNFPAAKSDRGRICTCSTGRRSLHEIGISVAHSGYHKHTAYILANADMPGFSKKEQARLSLLTLAQRGNLGKLQGQLKNAEDYMLAMSLRLAVLFYRNRSDIDLPALHGRFSGTKFHLAIDPDWLAQNPADRNRAAG